MKVLVCGDRNYTDTARVHGALDALDRLNGIEAVIEGCATGADSMGESWAREHGVPIRHFRPEWDKYGRAAGPVRNRQMLMEGRPDLVLAFHDNLEESKGTKDMVRQAQKAGIEVWHYAEKIGYQSSPTILVP